MNAGGTDAAYAFVQDYHDMWHLMAQDLGAGRYLTWCQRIVADQAGGAIPGLVMPGQGMCPRCVELAGAGQV